jgi:hypothetical protein
MQFSKLSFGNILNNALPHRLFDSILKHASASEWLLTLILLAFTWHYFWLMDDAFIYFRYIDNLLFLQRGLVFNFREYVEGYTSPVWLFLLIPLRLLELDYWTIVRWLSLCFAAIYALLLIAVNKALSPSSGRVVNIPLAIAAGHYGIATHLSSGLETPLVHIWAALLCLWLLRPQSRWVQILVGATPLVRPELVLALAICGLVIILLYKITPWSSVFSATLFCGGWLLFRVYYYADILPNTYYLKTVTQPVQGLWYLANGVVKQWWLSVLPVAWLAALLLGKNLKSINRYPRVVMMSVALVLLGWVVMIGGDMVHFRFMAASVTFILCAIAGVAESAISHWPVPKTLQKILPVALIVCAFGLALLSYPPQLSGHPLSDPEETQWHGIESEFWHRRHSQLKPKSERPQLDRELLEAYTKTTDVERYHSDVLVHPWCRRAFFDYTKYVVHSFGLTDSILAHTDAPVGRAGHRRLSHPAKQIASVVKWSKLQRRPGVYRQASNHGKTASWISDNLSSIELIERKIYNRHDFGGNLQLAFKRPKTIRLEKHTGK